MHFSCRYGIHYGCPWYMSKYYHTNVYRVFVVSFVFAITYYTRACIKLNHVHLCDAILINIFIHIGDEFIYIMYIWDIHNHSKSNRTDLVFGKCLTNTCQWAVSTLGQVVVYRLLPSCNLNLCWQTVSWILRNILNWNMYQNTHGFYV